MAPQPQVIYQQAPQPQGIPPPHPPPHTHPRIGNHSRMVDTVIANSSLLVVFHHSITNTHRPINHYVISHLSTGSGSTSRICPAASTTTTSGLPGEQ